MTRIRQSQRAKNAWVQQDGAFNIVFQQHEVPGMHIWLAPTTTLVCHLWYQTGMLFTAVMSQNCRIKLFQAQVNSWNHGKWAEANPRTFVPWIW